MTNKGIAALDRAFLEGQSWATICKFIRSSRFQLSEKSVCTQVALHEEPGMEPKSKTSVTPHDEYSKSVFQEIPHARGLLRAYLPPLIVKELNWKTLRLESNSFSSDELERDFADLLFSVQFKRSEIRQRLRVVFEHKRRPDRKAPRQLHRYIYRQFEQTPSGNALPCVITILLLQSGRCEQIRFSSEYRLPESTLSVLVPYMVDFQIIPIELSQMNEADLRGTEAGRLALALLKSVGAGKPMLWQGFRGILSDVCSHLSEEQRRRELRRAFVYLTSVIEPEQETEVRQAILSAKSEFEPVKEQFMSLLEHLETRGEARGEVRGEARGQRLARIEMLTNHLSYRMPDFSSEDAERLASMTNEGIAAVDRAFLEDQSWATIRKLIRSSRFQLSKAEAASK